MRIRTQLILASFVLAVIPLAAIVTYSYVSSREALESAYRREADRLTQQMDKRLASIRAELDQRLTFVSALPVGEANDGAEVGSSIAAAMGEVTSLVDSLEYKPIANPNPNPNPSLLEPAEPVEAAEPATAIASAGGQRPVIVRHAPHPPGAPIVIELPEAPVLPHYSMSEGQRELLAEIGRLGAKLGDQSLPQDERDDIVHEMDAAQKELNAVVAEDTRKYRQQLNAARQASREHRRVMQVRSREERGVPAPPAPPAAEAAPAVAAAPRTTPVAVRKVTANELARARASEKKTSLILGRKFNAPVTKQGEVVGQLTPRINADQVVRRVLGGAADSNEVPFAIDREGTLYTRTQPERRQLERLGIPQRVRDGQSVKGIPGWIVSTSRDEQSGLHIGVARPVGDNFIDLRRAAARNFFLGLGLIAFAVVGIVPLSNHLTRDVKLVTDGAARIAHGDLMTRLPVKTDNELGQLARAFNRMAEDLSLHQQKLIEQERARKEQELSRRLMAVEYERKSVELEDARRFQLSMLPKEVPAHKRYGIASFIQTATEVGGDYYDFHVAKNDVLSVAIGDATGHGAKAGTMVTVVKTLFAGYSGESPALFLHDAAEKIKRMELGRMAMALSVARFDGTRLTLASAGMPPALVHRVATGDVEEIVLGATPLGTLGTEYREIEVALASGDTVLFLTDGLPELMNDAGQQFGYTATLEAFAAAARAKDANGVISAMAAAGRAWHGDGPPNDDVTFVVVRVA